MDKQENKVTITLPAEGQCLAIAGGNYRIVISGEQTGGAYAVIDMIVPAHAGPGPHAHAGFQESFYVMEGEVEVTTELEKYRAPQGTFINIPLGGIVHQFKNVSDQMARLWCVVVPASLESFFMEIGTPVPAGTFLPAKAPTPEEMVKITAIGEKHGQKFFPPDYLSKKFA